MKKNNITNELKLIIHNLEKFNNEITSRVNSLDWNGKRDIIRQLIKRIEIEDNNMNIVYRVPQLHKNQLADSSQHCCNGTHGSVRGPPTRSLYKFRCLMTENFPVRVNKAASETCVTSLREKPSLLFQEFFLHLPPSSFSAFFLL